MNIQTLINEVIEKESQYKTGQRNNAKFSISDAGTCYRARVYKRLGYAPTREIEIEALRKMTAGSAGHEKLQGLLESKLLLSESAVETEHLLGHPDGVIKSNGVKELIEIKTIEKWQMGWIKKIGAKNEHLLQMFTYWSLLRTDITELNRAVLTYVKREDFEAHDFYFNWSDNVQKQVDDEWTPLIKHWIDKTLPDCTCHLMYDGKGPRYCRYLESWDEKEKTGKCCNTKLFKE